MMSDVITPDAFAGMLRIATPLILVAMGGLMCQRANILNISVEGAMLMGGFCAIISIDFFGSNAFAIFAGILGGAAMSLLFALFIIKFNANQILSGLAVNYMSAGMTTFLLYPMFGLRGGFRPDNMQMLPKVDAPFLQNAPVLNTVLNDHTITVYFGLIMVVVTSIILFYTPFGLKVRSVGESVDAVRTSGVNAERIQLYAIIWCGVMCGIAGAHLTTGYASEFTDSITQGRGYTAFSAVIFGNANPFYCFLACLVFGFADVIGIRFDLANVGISPAIIKMFPYTLAIIALASSSFVRKYRLSSVTDLN